MSPLDLHVLGTPPAFVLSQDQTLSFNPFIRIPSSRLGRSALRINCRFFLASSLCIVFKVRRPLSQGACISYQISPALSIPFLKFSGDFFAFFCASNDIFVYKFIVRLYVLYLVVCKRYTSSLFVSILLHSPHPAGKEADICSLRAVLRGFRLCGGDQGAFRSPPGPLRRAIFSCGDFSVSFKKTSMAAPFHGAATGPQPIALDTSRCFSTRFINPSTRSISPSARTHSPRVIHTAVPCKGTRKKTFPARVHPADQPRGHHRQQRPPCGIQRHTYPQEHQQSHQRRYQTGDGIVHIHGQSENLSAGHGQGGAYGHRHRAGQPPAKHRFQKAPRTRSWLGLQGQKKGRNAHRSGS